MELISGSQSPRPTFMHTGEFTYPTRPCDCLPTAVLIKSLLFLFIGVDSRYEKFGHFYNMRGGNTMSGTKKGYVYILFSKKMERFTQG